MQVIGKSIVFAPNDNIRKLSISDKELDTKWDYENYVLVEPCSKRVLVIKPSVFGGWLDY